MTAETGAEIRWRHALADWAGDGSLFSDSFFAQYGDRVWPVSLGADREAAHALHVELISRITTQPLGYNEGSEEAALTSVFSLFAAARELAKKFPDACAFETIVWHVLNTFVRPFTAKWHVKAATGELRALDSSDVFRSELEFVQRRLIALDAVLAMLANAEWYSVDSITRPGELAILAEMRGQVEWKPMGEPSSVAVTRPRSPEENAKLEALRKKEMAYVKRRRQHYKVNDENWASGLALSGGGIRSATFAMGVLVSLGRRNLLPQFDYLSTVSGGGYTGSFLTQLLGSPESHPNLSLKSTALPFKREEGESLLLQRVRHGASFLSAGISERLAVAIAQAQGIFINIIVLVLLISLLANAQIVASNILEPLWTVQVAAFFLIGFFAWTLIFPIERRFADKNLPRLNKINALICWSLVIPPMWALAQGANSLATMIRESLAPDRTLLSGYAFVFLVTFGAIFSIGCALFVGFSRIRPVLLASSTILFVILFEGFVFQILNGLDYGTVIKGLFALIMAGAVLLVTLDVNTTSLHYYYRAKLANAFFLNQEAVPVRPIRLSDIQPERAMFPILNCALNVPGSKMPEMRGRHADLFSFTPVSAGANLIGHSAVCNWEFENYDLDLATAMALSGAAISPQMGLRTTRYGSFWLTLLNLRLNQWLKNPNAARGYRSFPDLSYLAKELSAGADEKGAFVNISDGGHIENLGVYELLRRRCRFIVAVDGENDAQMTFHALTNLQRLAYIDFGITIEANLEDLRLGEKGLSRSHFRFCRIRYPSGAGDRGEEIGYLVYLKLSLTGNEGEFIRRYKLDEPYPSEQSRRILSAARGNVGSWRSMRTRSTMRFWRCYG